MNQYLKTIQDLLQQKKDLNEADKEALLKAIADADKQWSITDFKLDRTEKVKKTTAILLEETIEELEQKRKAVEAQNRELEIESSLEKVRTVAMGMRKRDDMMDICRMMSKQLESLGIKEIRNVQTAIFYKDKGIYVNYEYYRLHDKTLVTEVVYTNDKISIEFAAQMTKGTDEFFTRSLAGKEVKDWYNFQKTTNVFIDTYLETATSLTYYWFSLGPVALGLSSYLPLNEGDLNLFKRFRNVFGLAYQRYIDIEQAEAQAREAKIEAALERTRTQSMIMQYSKELDDTLRVFHEQILLLGIKSAFSFLWLPDEEKERHIFWAAWAENKSNFFKSKAINYPLDRNEPATAQCLVDWKGNEPIVSYHVPPAGVKNYFAAWQELIEGVEQLKPEYFSGGLYYVEAFMKFGCFGVMVATDLREDEKKILGRFAIEFERTYTRFLDLQKAEAQAREAQIEAALERVRSRTMAMHKSDELAETAAILIGQLNSLGIVPLSLYIGIMKDNSDDLEIWSTDENGKEIKKGYTANINKNSSIKKIYDACLAKEKSIVLDMQGKVLEDWLTYWLGELQLSFESGQLFQRRVQNIAYFSKGFIAFTSTNEQPPATIQLLERFAAVFNLSYTRFIDLQKAEAQTKEAQIEAALERVRSRTLAMQKSDELAETAAVLFQQLIALGIEPNRLYIAIVKDENGETEFWITDEDGTKVSAAFETNLNDNASFKKMLQGWKEERKSLVIDMHGEELQGYFKYLSSIHVPFKGGLTQKRRVQDIAYFSQGFIGTASPDEQPAATLQLMERFAYVFNLTFTRFNDLKIAEAHALQAEQDLIEIKTAKQKAEEALTELQATQRQLIQSEKMASLGELTAGIAHEIQNPLNFVNNFSDVSSELLDEMKTELEKGNKEDAMAIVDDVKQNLEKILHHGKRADAIVKGMLQHSRTGSGQKELTDINALADEYLRLAYHGLRAKDKSFNAKLESNFDKSIGKINVIPQDIGRVLVNLINNAFYAASLSAGGGFPGSDKRHEPTVWLATKKEGNKVLISVRDNGPGIPPQIKDKIFQPFFTTKPTGQGTGLGLSLAYDIVKAHSGELKVETKEGEGSTFIILLPFKEIV